MRRFTRIATFAVVLLVAVLALAHISQALAGNTPPWNKGTETVTKSKDGKTFSEPTTITPAPSPTRYRPRRAPRVAPDTLLVQMTPGASIASMNTVHAKVGATVKRSYKHVRWQVVKLPKGMSVAAARAAYAAAGVAKTEPDYLYEVSVTPNDPSYSQLWGMEAVNAPAAWDTQTGSADIVIADIDTGVDYTHPDLAANMWVNPGEVAGNGIDDDNNGYIDDIYGYDACNVDSDPMDDHGHGSHTCGTIGGVGNNGVGVAGVNWQIKMMALKFLSSDGSGTTEGAIACYDYVITMKQRGVNIRAINNSWGGGGFSQALKDAIDAAGALNIISCCAAGNDYGIDTDVDPHYPATYDCDSIIAVAASDDTDQMADFSNYGATTVDIAAPGVGILSTLPNNNYDSWNGTSMATPLVTGAVALMAAENPSTTGAEIKDILLNTVDVLPQWEGKVLSGGRMNLAEAMSALMPNISLTLNRTQASESEGLLTNVGAISIPEALNANLLVTLASSDTSEASFNEGTAAITIPAGQTSASFSLLLVDDAEWDGPQEVTLTATADGYFTAEETFTVLDDEYGSMAQFVFSPVGAAQTVGTGFPVHVSACDAKGNVLIGYNGPVSLTGQSTGVTTIGQADITWSYPLYTYFEDARTQTIYTQAEVGEARDLTGLALNVNQLPGQTMLNFTIRLKHTAQSAFTTAALDGPDTGWEVVYQQDVTVSSTGWVEFPFTTAFAYNGQDNLIVDISFNNSSWTDSGYCWATNYGEYRSVYARTDSQYGDPLDWNPSTGISCSLSNQAPDIRLLSPVTAIPVTPQTIDFFNGEWEGFVTVNTAEEGMNLKAVDGGGRTGLSNEFNVLGAYRFEWDPISSPQEENTPFSATIRAVDRQGRLVRSYNSVASLSGSGFQMGMALADDFEDGDFSGWENADLYPITVTDETAANGTAYSVKMAGGDAGYISGLSYPMPEQPKHVSFHIRTSSNSIEGAVLELGSGTDFSQLAAAFLCESWGEMGLFMPDMGFAGVPYEPNTWYKITLELDWDAQTIDYYVDDVLQHNDVPFFHPVDSATRLSIYNWNSVVSYWDEFVVNGSVRLPIETLTPTTVGFVDGVATTQVTVPEPFLSVILTAEDEELAGDSNAFDVATFQADLHAAPHHGAWVGDDLYTAAEQIVTQTVAPGQSNYYRLRVQNDGNVTDTFTIGYRTGQFGATALPKGWSVSLIDAAGKPTTLTSQFELGPGESTDFTISVAAGATQPVGSAITLFIDAKSVHNTVKADTVKTISTVGYTYQADGQIGLESYEEYFLGDEVYNQDGTDQSYALTVSASEPAVYYLLLQNDGNAPQKIAIDQSVATPAGWTVRYFDSSEDGNDITAAVVDGAGWWTPTQLVMDGTRMVRVEVTPSEAVDGTATCVLPINFLSESTPTVVGDTVKTTTTNRLVHQPDGKVKGHEDTEFIGDNLYDTWEYDQTKYIDTANGVAAVYTVAVENDGNRAETYQVYMDSAPEGWILEVIDPDGTAITNAITSDDGWLTPTIARGSSITLTVKVTPDANQPVYSYWTAELEIEPSSYEDGFDWQSDAIWMSTSVAERLLPDLQIKKLGDASFIGNDIYNTTGAGQTRTLDAGRGQVVRLQAKLENDGNIVDSFVLSFTNTANASAARVVGISGVTPSWDTKADIGTATSGGFTFSDIPVGESVLVDLDVEIPLSATNGTVFHNLLTASSTYKPSAVDCVKASLTVATIVQPDLLVRAGTGTTLGNDLYNTTGEGQTAAQTTFISQPAPYTVTLQNDGTEPDGFNVTGTGSTANWTVRYFNATTNQDLTDILTGAASTGIVIDNTNTSNVAITGKWVTSTVAGGWGANYLHDGALASQKTTARVVFTPRVPVTGQYAVYAWWAAAPNRSASVPVDITHANGSNSITVNQQTNGGQWRPLGVFPFTGNSTTENITIRCTGTDGYYVVADAIRLVPVISLGAGESLPIRVEVTPGASTPAGEIYPVTITATSMKNATKADTVKAVTTVASLPEVDAQISTDNVTFTGDGIYRNLLAQTKQMLVPASNMATYWMRFQNDSTLPDTVKVTAPAVPTGFQAKFFAPNGVDITSQVNGAGWLTPVLQPNEATLIKVEVRISTALANGSRLKLPVTGTSKSVPDRADTVQAVVYKANELIIDNPQATKVGTWGIGSSTPGYYGSNYHVAAATAVDNTMFYPLNTSGTYKVYLRWASAANRASNVPVDIISAYGTTTATVNQRVNGGSWFELGTFEFSPSTTQGVKIRMNGVNGFVIADAVKFVQADAAVIMDNAGTAGVTITGSWTPGASGTGFLGANYLHDGNTGKGTKSVRYQPTLLAGTYDVYIRYVANVNRATNVPVSISHAGGTTTVPVNQRNNGGTWFSVGRYQFSGLAGHVLISNNMTDGYVVADGVRFVPVD